MADTQPPGISSDVADTEDPLIKALPPASDYMTYLTVLEYQLTSERLPTLHRLLQDEQLTTNIGWDLVQLLLPMLPASQECLRDVAHLGNPREVILRVSDALMKLDSAEDDDIDIDDYNAEDEEEAPGAGNKEGQEVADSSETVEAAPQTSLHVLQFTSLLDMLAILHSRIKTKYPSRFIATSIQAALEAYTSYPLAEITDPLLDFLRSLSPNKRPMLPPRANTDRPGTASSAAEGVSAPDPEAEEDHMSSRSEQGGLVQKLLQFALIEVLKTYMVHCTGRAPAGMQWALRLQEKLDPAATPPRLSKIREFSDEDFLAERDRTIGKIVALSRDIGLNRRELLAIVLGKAEDQPAPLDFEELPEAAENIPLERHGCLLLLTARFASSILFDSSEQEEATITVYPDLCTIISNFLGQHDSTYGTIIEEPMALTGSILALALMAHHRTPMTSPPEEPLFRQVILTLTACVRGPSFRANSRLEQIPSNIFHSNPDAGARFRLVHDIFKQQEALEYAQEPAVRWLKEELVAATSGVESLSLSDNPFTDPSSFSTLYSLIYKPLPISVRDLREGPSCNHATAFLQFVEKYAPVALAALNLYFLLLHSRVLRQKFDLAERFNSRLRDGYLGPLSEFAVAICEDEDLASSIESQMGGGEGLVSMAQGAAAMVKHTIEDIERLMENETHQG